MPTNLTIFLLCVLAIHFAIFLRLYLKRKQPNPLLLCLTFLLLVCSFALRLWLPDCTVATLPAHWIPRAAAWITSIIFLLRKFRHKQ